MGKLIATSAALGVTLSTATQLRLQGLPFGVPEAILTAWMLFAVFLLLRGAPAARGRVFLGVTGYWLVSIVLLCLGATVGIHTGRSEFSQAAHDGLAFAFVSVAACLLTLRFYDREGREYHLHMARAMFLFQSLAAAVMLGLAYLTATLGPIGFWYAGIRFRGWAVNPNQMALAMVAMPFLGCYLLTRASGLLRKAGYLLLIGICVVCGIATQSDALRVAWAASACVFGSLLWLRTVVRGRGRWLHVSHAMIPLVVVVVGVALGDQLVGYLHGTMVEVYEAGDQGSLRFAQWANGLKAIASSPLVGLGPGAFSGTYGPFLNYEAHNSLIDWGMSTGIVGILLHLTLWGWCVARSLKAGSLPLLSMAIAIIVFSVFGYTLRHPVYWLDLILILVLSERRAEVRVRQPPSLLLERRQPELRPAQLNSR